jgi:hypothetical protein
MSYRGDVTEAALDQLSAVLFTSLRRIDQRTRGVEYLHGLLRAEGRKSIRNIAATTTGPAGEQSLHHFISDSTWDWVPVRRALTEYLVRRKPPQAWVLRLLTIPKAGNHSVGVVRRLDTQRGRARNAQHAFGVWAATEEASSPVHWRLHLTEEWLSDQGRRRRTSIPDSVTAEPFGAGGVTTFLEAAAWPESPTRPVVLDARDLDVVDTVRRLRAARVPVLARIDGRTPLLGIRPGAEPVPAHHLLGAARGLCRPVSWTEPGPVPTTRTCLAAAVRATLPGLTTDLLLLGTAPLGRPWPAELWLTDLPAIRPTGLVRLTTLMDRVDQDLANIAEPMGIRDFAGRSFAGWHRHVTLASAAHALAVLSTPTRQIRYTG